MIQSKSKLSLKSSLKHNYNNILLFYLKSNSIQIWCETSQKTHSFSYAVIISSICCSIFKISSYGIHFYTGKSTISSGKFHGHNAGILVNGGALTLKGTIDVSSNYFGGIEVSKGAAAGLEPSVLDISECVLVNDSEEYGKPTVWIDGIDETVGRVIGGNLTEVLFTKEDGTQQLHYYLHPINARPAK